MSVIQFESVVEGNLIRIPEEYVNTIHSGTKVTVRLRNCRADAGNLLPDDFTDLRLDTRDFKFNREEANERR